MIKYFFIRNMKLDLRAKLINEQQFTLFITHKGMKNSNLIMNTR